MCSTWGPEAQPRAEILLQQSFETVLSSLTWSSCPEAIAEIRRVVGFIEGDPELHLISQPLEKQLGVFLKPLNYGVVLPPADVLQRLREVPVVDGHLRGASRERAQPVVPSFQG